MYFFKDYYDQLNRLRASRSYETGLSGNTWNPMSYGNEYFNAFTYDGNGNILTQIRNNRQGTTIDSLTYKYRYNSDQKLIRNRLYHINDAVNTTAFNDDIDDQGNFNDNPLFFETTNNYVRDKMGRLVKDKQEYIDTILWTATNKVKAVIKTPSDTLKNIYFDYDAFGNQIAKHIYNAQTMILEKSTYYLLDAQSNQLSIYEHTVDENESTAKYYLAERNIYGSSVLGTSRDTVNMMNPVTLPSYGIMGNRQYQLSEHRGNVLAVISDIKYPIFSDNSTIDSYEVGIVNIADYSPFGVELDGRTIQNSKYRYSFQNQEHHDEIKGKGNYLNYKYRGYDPRIGRLDWTLDPLAPKYPELTPYQFSSNRVLDGVELEGLEVFGLNPMNYINQKATALFDNNFGKNVSKSASDLTKGAAKHALNTVINNLDIIGTVVTTAGYTMYLTPYAPGAPAVVKAGEGISLLATGIEVYDDVFNKGDYTNASIQVGITLVFQGTGFAIKKAKVKELITKNDANILNAVNEAMGQAYSKIYIPNIQKVGDITFDSNKATKQKEGYFKVIDIKTKKILEVDRLQDGSYKLHQRGDEKKSSKSKL